MIYFLKGIVANIEKDYIIIEVNNIGYQVFLAKTDCFKLTQETMIYTYNVIKEEENYLVGFASIDEKKMFLNLIKVKGLGPKTALNILNYASLDSLKNAIQSNNLYFLKKLPNVGNKLANQILLDLNGEIKNNEVNKSTYDEAFEALKSLGFKTNKIMMVLSEINDCNLTLEDVIKQALSKLNKLR